MFAIDRPHWVRYLLLRFLSQHGGEAVCALNSVGAFGKSAVEELEDQLAAEERLGLLPPELDVSGPEPGPAADAPAPTPAPAQDTPLPAGAPPPAPADAPAAQQAGDAQQDVQPPRQQQQQQHAQEAQPPLLSSGGGAALASEASRGALASAALPAQPSPAAPASQQQQPSQQQPQRQQQPPQQPPQQHPATAAPTSAAGNASGDIRSSNLTAPSSADSKEPMAAGQPSQPQPSVRQPGTDGQAATPPGSSSQPATRQHKASSTVMTKRMTHVAPKQPEQQPESPLLPAGSKAAGAGISSGGLPQAAAPPSEAAASPGAPSSVQQQEQQQFQASSPAVASNAPTAPPPAAAASPPGSGGEAEEVLELPLARLTAKGKSGGSVYELLVQEIKAAKLQHKLLAKNVAEVARNASAAYSELAGDLASLAAAVAKVRAPLLLAGTNMHQPSAVRTERRVCFVCCVCPAHGHARPHVSAHPAQRCRLVLAGPVLWSRCASCMRQTPARPVP